MNHSSVRPANFSFYVTRMLMFMLLSTPLAANSQSTDTFVDKIYLKNGDRVTGTVKELDRGKLRVKTTTMDTVYLNWVDVESIDSNTYLRVAKTDGTFIYGRVHKSDLTENLEVIRDGAITEVPAIEIASIKPIRVDESLWHRFEGEVSAGVDYQKASDILLANLASGMRLREEKYEIDVSLNWNETRESEKDGSSRADLNGGFTRYLKDLWFWKASLGFQRNQELGIDLRTITSGTAGKYLFQTSTMRFEINAGLAVSSENLIDDTTQESVEGLIQSSFDIFKLNIPKTRLSAQISIYPGITESSRIRVNTDVKLRNELIRDVYWEVLFYSNYDNQPVEGAEKDDYGLITSLGVSF